MPARGQARALRAATESVLGELQGRSQTWNGQLGQGFAGGRRYADAAQTAAGEHNRCTPWASLLICCGVGPRPALCGCAAANPGAMSRSIKSEAKAPIIKTDRGSSEKVRSRDSLESAAKSRRIFESWKQQALQRSRCDLIQSLQRNGCESCRLDILPRRKRGAAQCTGVRCPLASSPRPTEFGAGHVVRSAATFVRCACSGPWRVCWIGRDGDNGIG